MGCLYPLTQANSVLSSSALNALKEFYADRDARLKQFEDLKAVAEENAAGTATAKPLNMEAFSEDWNASQFWVRFLYQTEITRGAKEDSPRSEPDEHVLVLTRENSTRMRRL
jgi:hypothetical protein